MILQPLAHANDRREAGFKRSLRLFQHVRILLVKVLTAFAMADQGPGSARGVEHLAGDFSRESPLFGPIEILAADAHVCSARGCNRSGNRDADGEDDNVTVIGIAQEGKETVEEASGLLGGFVHLPIGRHYGPSHRLKSELLSFLNLMKKASAGCDMCAEVFGDGLADVGKSAASPQVYAALRVSTIGQQRCIFA